MHAPALPFLAANPMTRTPILARLAARPWDLPADLVTAKLESYVPAGPMSS